MRLFPVVLCAGFFLTANAAYSQNTDVMYNHLEQCVSKSQAGIDCITPIRNQLDRISSYLGKIHEIRKLLDKIKTGFDTLNNVMSIAKYVPGVGTAVNTLKITISRLQTPINQAQARAKAIDDVTYKIKVAADQGVIASDGALAYLNYFKDMCTRGRDTLNSARNCVNNMREGSLKSNLGNSLESFGTALNDKFAAVNSVLSSVTNTCSNLRSILNIDVNWPNIDDIFNALNSFAGALQPILDFFGKIRDVLNRRLCIPDPLEKLREVEVVEEIAEALNPLKWGRRRSITKRAAVESGLQTVVVTREQANTILSLQKRGDICISIQDIIDGVNKIFDVLLGAAQKALNELLSQLPSFSLPGLPDFSRLFNLNININLPDINFGLDVMLQFQFIWFKWDCAVQVNSVCAAASGAVSFNCAKPLNQYTFTFNWNFFGRKKRSGILDSDDIMALLEYRELTSTDKLEISTTTIAPNVSNAFTNDALLSLEIQPSEGKKVDDKNLTPEQAFDMMTKLTEEQMRMLALRLDAKEQAVHTTAATTTQASREDVARRVADIILALQSMN